MRVLTKSNLARVAAVNDYDLVVAGVGRLLSGFPDRLEVVDCVTVGEALDASIDVALYDTYGRRGLVGPALEWLCTQPGISRVAVFSLDLNAQLVDEARRMGVHSFISKALPAQQIADAVVAVARGEAVVALAAKGGSSPELSWPGLSWPGQAMGLTERESEVLVLVSDGLTNREVATALYLSPETVKSYLREVYAKLGVRNRVEATLYARSIIDGGRGNTPVRGC